MISFEGRYYIFASMTLGVWVSDDLLNWENHRLPEELPLYDYATDVRVVEGFVYFSASNREHPCDYYRTKDILNGPYEKIEGTFPFWDPNLFRDDDGRIYFYPEALAHVIRKVHEDFKGDLIVTENGVAVSDDRRRVEFIRRALEGVKSCLDDGIPVRGYCYWSLMDNFEWQKGYSMTFGLISVDRSTLERTPKESLYFLGSYAQ